MKIETLDLSTLLVQENYNVRAPGELHSNAKEIASLMEATGDNHEDPRFLIRYAQNGKGKYTRSHATLEAAKMRKWEKVCAVKVAFEAGTVDDDLDLIHSNNAGHPLTRYQQGAVYARLRDGIWEDSQEAIARTAMGEEVQQKNIREPMKMEDIAAKTNKTRQHIADCITIYESPEAVGDMIEEGKISSGIVVTAAGWAKNKSGEVSDTKLTQILRAAHARAKSEGDEKATKKHLDAIKAQFVEQKAVSTTPKAADKPKAAETKPESEDGATEGNTEPPAPEAQLDLTTPADHKDDAHKPLSQAAQKTLRSALFTLIVETDSEIDDDLANRLCDRIIDAGLAASELPF